MYEDIVDDVKKQLDTSNYQVECNIIDRPLPTWNNKRSDWVNEIWISRKIMTEFAALRPKAYSYLMDDGISYKKGKGTKKCVMKRILKFNYYKNCLIKNEIILKSPQGFKSEAHNVCT